VQEKERKAISTSNRTSDHSPLLSVQVHDAADAVPGQFIPSVSFFFPSPEFKSARSPSDEVGQSTLFWCRLTAGH
jgi:hypothetical protein